MQRPGFSLASILLLTVVAAVFLASLRALLIGNSVLDEPPSSVSSILGPYRAAGGDYEGIVCLVGVLGAAVAVMIGGSVGAQNGRPALGMLAGLVFGGLSAVLLLDANLLILAAVVSPILVLFALAVRRFSGRPRGP